MTFRFSPEYAAVADVPVKFTIDPRALSRPPTQRTVRHPDEMVT